MKKADNFDSSKWLVENKITFQSKLNEEKPTDDMVKDYWSIMVQNQPEDVVKILVGLTNGDLPFEKFSLDTANDVYDSFKDESYDDEDEELDESKLNEGANIYPFQASPEQKALYNKISNELEGTISMVANKLSIPKSDIRISLDSLWDEKYKNKGMIVQVKADDTEWKKAWTGNALIMQTLNGEGVTISSYHGTDVNGNKNPKVRTIYNKSLDLDLESLVATENAKIADSLTPKEIELIAPNTPVIVTGK